jgi:Ketopantoate reductase PanE/ApbA C terminal
MITPGQPRDSVFGERAASQPGRGTRLSSLHQELPLGGGPMLCRSGLKGRMNEASRCRCRLDRRLFRRALGAGASIGAITCLMRGTIGEVEAAPGGREFIFGAIDEAVAIISAVGVPPSDAAVDNARAQLTQRGSTHTSSMFRDLQKGHPVEADEIIGDLVRRGRAAGIAAPLLAAAYAHLSVYAGRTTT